MLAAHSEGLSLCNLHNDRVNVRSVNFATICRNFPNIFTVRVVLSSDMFFKNIYYPVLSEPLSPFPPSVANLVLILDGKSVHAAHG